MKSKVNNLVNIGRKSPEGELPVLGGFLDFLYARPLSGIILKREPRMSKLGLKNRLLESSRQSIRNQQLVIKKLKERMHIHTASRGPTGGASQGRNSS